MTTNFQKKIKNSIVALGVALLVGVDILILGIYYAVEGAKNNLSIQRVVSMEDPRTIEGVSIL